MAACERRHWWFAGKRAIIRDLLRRYLTPPPGRRPLVADVGCGTGALLEELSREYDVIGADGSPLARDLAARKGLTVLPCHLPADLPLPREGCDAVIMSDVLEHIDDDAGSARSAAAALRPGGVFIATVPAHPWLWTRHDDHHHHKRRYTRSGFARLFENAGLSRELLSYYNIALFPAMVGSRMLSRALGINGKLEAAVPPAPINAIARAVFSAEGALLPRMASPIGASLIAVYRKPA